MDSLHQKLDLSQALIERDWKASLKNAYKSPYQLLEKLGLTDRIDISPHQLFKTLVPQAFVKRMVVGDIHDPLLLQVLPLKSEEQMQSGYSDDPLQERGFTPIKGLLHKYRNRVLLIANGACAVHCRYCFRRSFDYSEHQRNQSSWTEVFAYIRSHDEIDEVIFSGGDPLMHGDDYLAYLLNEITQIEHVARVRIHTRIPIVLPERVTPILFKLLGQYPKPMVMVIHANHPNEIDDEVRQVLLALKCSGVTLLNQSTLLKRVNDNAEVLKELSERLFECGVMPYYLHVLDKVQGASHYEITDDEAKVIHQQLKNSTSGYLVPKLTREVAGEMAKTWV